MPRYLSSLGEHGHNLVMSFGTIVHEETESWIELAHCIAKRL